MKAIRVVGITEAKPDLMSEFREAVDEMIGVPREAESALRIDSIGEGVADDVDVRTNMDAVELSVISCVDDDREVFMRDGPDYSAQIPRSTDAACQHYNRACRIRTHESATPASRIAFNRSSASVSLIRRSANSRNFSSS